MLTHLHIKNVALIEEVSVDFENGFNILSGETGAGKSMLIDSLNFALGEKASKDFLRLGETSAVVEALFVVDESLKEEIVASMEINWEDDNSVLITRTLNEKGRTVAKVNGYNITQSMLKNLSAYLIDIHGQHEHQSLLNANKHLYLLDKFCEAAISKLKTSYMKHFKEYKQVCKTIADFDIDDRMRAQRLDLLNFQSEEIFNANLEIDEEEQLLKTKKDITNSENISDLTNNALELLYDGTENELSSLDKFDKAMSYLADLNEIENFDAIYDKMNDVFQQFSDVCLEFNKFARNLDFATGDIDEIEERLNLIYNLKRKYGSSVAEIIEYNEKITVEIDELNSFEKNMEDLQNKKAALLKKVKKLAVDISKIRKEKAKYIEESIEEQLKTLEMKNAKFEINFDKKNELTIDGIDKVEFLISANLGETLKPLAKIASGGEMSRVMLCLKAVLANIDNIDTFIFDEIDVGISGRTAQKVAEKMAFISRNYQVICITHLPQIASMADRHFLIQKNVVKEKTITDVFQIEDEKITGEIARLIGGTKITDATLKAADEMKVLATNYKKDATML